MSPPAQSSTPPLWAITSYFNSQHYQRRLQNYRLFRARMTVPLLTLNFPSTASLSCAPTTPTYWCSCRPGTSMWHKERLLNVALSAVPPDCRKIAWLDCDVVFEQRDWAGARATGSINSPWSSLFKTFVKWGGRSRSTKWIIRTMIAGDIHWPMAWRLAPWTLTSSTKTFASKVGMAGWPGRRAARCSSSTVSMTPVSWKRHPGDGVRRAGPLLLRPAWLQMNARWTDHYLAWARPHFDTVRGSIGFVGGELLHLRHGI